MREGGVADPDLLDFMMGHSPRYGGAYDRFDTEYVRKEYARAEPMLSAMFSQGSPERQVPRLAKGNTDESKAQRIVRESDLEGYFKEGWQYVATLPSGRIVVG